VSILAQSSPPALVGLPGSEIAAGPGFDYVTPLLWLAVAITVAAGVIFAWRWFMTRETRSVRSSAVLVTMCRGMKLTAADQRTLKQLAKREGSVTPVTMILCPSVFERAVAKAGDAVNKDSVHRLRQRLAS
jgi:hypothetical protein